MFDFVSKYILQHIMKGNDQDKYINLNKAYS